MWEGLLQLVGDLQSKNWGFPEAKKFCLRIVTQKSWVSICWPVDFRLASPPRSREPISENLSICLSIYLSIISLSIYHLSMYVCMYVSIYLSIYLLTYLPMSSIGSFLWRTLTNTEVYTEGTLNIPSSLGSKELWLYLQEEGLLPSPVCSLSLKHKVTLLVLPCLSASLKPSRTLPPSHLPLAHHSLPLNYRS